MDDNDSLREFGKILKSFIKIAKDKLDNLAFLNLIILFGLLLFSTVGLIGEGISSIAYTAADIIAQYSNKKHVIHEVDNIPLIAYLVFILLGFVICMYFVKLDREGKLWK